MRDKSYKKIRNQIIAGVSSGFMVGMLLIGGTNNVYAETTNKTIPLYSFRKTTESNQDRTQISKPTNKKMSVKSTKSLKGWRKNQNLI